MSRHVLYSLVGAEGGATAGAGVSDLLQVVHTVRHQAAAQPQPEDAAAEGESPQQAEHTPSELLEGLHKPSEEIP